MNIKNKKTILISTCLIVLLVGLLFAVKVSLDDKKDSQADSTEVPTSAVDNDSTAKYVDNDDSTEDVVEEYIDAKAMGQPQYEVTQNISSTWEQDGKYVAQLDIRIKNNSKTALDDWSISFANAGDAEILTGWNGKYELRDGMLFVSPESYNNTVDVNAYVECGVQLMFTDKAMVDNIPKNGELYISGEKVDVAMMVSDKTESDGGSNDSADATTTTEKESEKIEITTEDDREEISNGTPYEIHGALAVKGTDLVDVSGSKYQLKGVSTHGLAWFPDYVNKDAFRTFRDDWGANVIRLAMYTDENGGYCTDGNQDNLKRLVKEGIDEATKLGMYVIVDWHILHDLTPLKYQDKAEKFFDEISSEYRDSDNIIYEICNEPNGDTGWQDIKKYAEDIIPVIRKNDSNAIIVVGTPTWSQDVDIAADDPIEDYDNIMYTLHFYASTHKDELRKKLTTAKNAGLPIFITEFSICEASGDGTVDYDSADEWFKLINENNISYCAWNISNKEEKSSLIKSSVTKKSDWSEDELSDTGLWIRQQMK